MKLFNIIMTFLLLVFISCEVTETVPVRISMVNIKPEVVRLHLAVYSGEDVLAQKSVDVSDLAEDNMIELFVSPGKNRLVVLLAECYDGEGPFYIGYSGKNTTDLYAGKEVKVSLNVTACNYTYWDPYSGAQKGNYWVTYYDNQGYYTFQWNSTGIPKVKYVIEHEIGNGYYENIYNGYGITCGSDLNENATDGAVIFYPYYELFNLSGKSEVLLYY